MNEVKKQILTVSEGTTKEMLLLFIQAYENGEMEKNTFARNLCQMLCVKTLDEVVEKINRVMGM